MRNRPAVGLALAGTILVSLAVPVIFAEMATSLVWAGLGASLFRPSGLRRSRLAGAVAILLQGAGGYLFLDKVFYPIGSTVFVNSYFFSCLFIGSCSLSTGWLLDKRKHEGFAGLSASLLMIWGLLWWYVAGYREITVHYLEIAGHDAFLLYSSAVSMIMTIAAGKLPWRRLGTAQLVFLPVVLGCGIAGYAALSPSSHLFAGKGWLAWQVAAFCQVRMLLHYQGVCPKHPMLVSKTLTSLLAAVVLCHELNWAAAAVFGLSARGAALTWLLLPVLFAGAWLPLARTGPAPKNGRFRDTQGV